MLVLVSAMLMALGVSFVCSFVEAGLLSLTPANVADLTRENPAQGKIWQEFKSDIGRPISVILLLNTTAHTIGAAVAGARFSGIFGDDMLWAFSLLFTFLMLQYTEILPKTLGVRYKRTFARMGAQPLWWAVKALSPVITLIHWINRPFERGGHGDEKDGEGDAITEIASLASMARMSNLIGRKQERIISTATHLSTITAKQVMIPVDQVSFLSTRNTIAEAFLLAHMDLHTRYPVRDDGLPTRIVGYVNFKEMVYFMSTNPKNPSLLGIIRPLNFVDPETSAAELLRMFVDQHNHMVVVGRRGGEELGIVTVEDVIEEMVGEIEDEFDRLPQYVHSLAGEVWLVGGGTPMRTVAERLAVTLPDDAMTMADWVTARLGGAVRGGAVATEGRHEFTVRRIKRGKIFDVTITDKGGEGDAHG